MMEVKGSLYWKKLRHQALNCDEEANDNTACQEVLCVSTHFVAFGELITKYVSGCESISEKSDEHMGNPTLQLQHEKSDEEKGLILEARQALRYLLTLLCQENHRMYIQEEAVCIYKLHRSVCSLLSTEHCDKKCQIMAAKILCNLGTCNRTASSIMLNEIKASPDSIISKTDNPDETRYFSMLSSWGEMIHVSASTGQRETLAIIVASIHNFIIAGSNSIELNEKEEKSLDSCRRFGDVEIFDISTYASDKILMCNLVRYILPKETITLETTLESDNDKAVQEKDMSDDATSWIALLLEVLCRNGMFPEIYNSLGFNKSVHMGTFSDEGDENYINKKGVITPEQVVLINCFSDSIDTYAQSLSGKDDDFRENPLGGIAGEKAIEATVYFLAEKWLEFQHNIHFSNSPEEYNGENSCIMQAQKIILDILGTSLSCRDEGGNQTSNDTCFSSIRLHLGQNTALLKDAILELGIIIDRLEIENRGVKARELVVSQHDQHCIIGLIRLIGNLCYRCKPNQDVVRNTGVPAPSNEKHIDEATKVDGTFTPPKLGIKPKRNGLHVILSCTSFAYGCFTLREWGIVAIRNVLEGNHSNQEEVAKLEAQQVINTPELDRFGIKLDLDKKGKVIVDRNNMNTNLNSEQHR